MEGDVSSLSEEELGEIRSVLTEMSQNDPAAQALSSENSSKLTGEDVKTLLTMFMMNMQSTSSLFSDDSSSNDSSIYSLLGSSDSSMETMLSNILSKLSGESEDEETQTQSVSQKAAAAYEQSMLSV